MCMTPKEIQEHIDNGTLLDILVSETEFDAKPHEKGKMQLELRFPQWYHIHISEESKLEIESLIRKNSGLFFNKQ